MKVIFLAAGIGKRLKPYNDNNPKILIDIGGKTILEYNIETLNDLGVKNIVLVVGYCQEMIKNKVKEKDFKNIRFIENKEYAKGSILSLYLARNEFTEDTLIMDADVLYDKLLLKKLIDSKNKNCFLIDTDFKDSGEEMKLFIKNGFVKTITRGLLQGFDEIGESVGFLKLAKENGQILKQLLEEFINNGKDDLEYEDVLAELMKKIDIGYKKTSGLLWTEIDFKEDIEKAQKIYKLLK